MNYSDVEALTLNKKEESSKQQEYKDVFLINEKKEWIRLKKRLDFMSDLNPLTLNIEQIYTLPEKIKVAEDDGSIPE